MNNPDQIRSLLQDLIADLWNAADLSVAPRLFTENCILHLEGDGAHGGHDYCGREAFITGYIEPTLRNFPDIRYKIMDSIIDSDRGVIRFCGDGPVAPEHTAGEAGKCIASEGIAIFRIAEDRIDEIWVHWNWDSALAKLLSN